MAEGSGAGRRGEWVALVFALLYPTLLTLVYFVWLAGSSGNVQQVSYLVGKAIQFCFPLVCVGLICREVLSWPRFNRRGIAAGIAFGLIISAAICGLYLGRFRDAGTFAAAGKEMLARLSGLGITSAPIYIVVALFYSLLHSLLEEYYWRWFVFGRLRHLIAVWPAIVISSVCFMLHHVVVLSLYFGWFNPWTWLFSISTAVGGAFWAWLYHRTGSIYGPWLSHMLIDAAIFGIGYDLLHSATMLR
jgi:membrane protease YdiL (CAAX protease family)